MRRRTRFGIVGIVRMPVISSWDRIKLCFAGSALFKKVRSVEGGLCFLAFRGCAFTHEDLLLGLMVGQKKTAVPKAGRSVNSRGGTKPPDRNDHSWSVVVYESLVDGP
jgi:hypothetical protein